MFLWLNCSFENILFSLLQGIQFKYYYLYIFFYETLLIIHRSAAMSSNITPYIEAELFGDEEDSRSLHNDANKFYREVMHLKTPLAQKDLPKCSVVADAIKHTARTNAVTEILLNIRATPFKNLWPDDTQVPGHFIGVLWKAVQDSIPEIPGYTDQDDSKEIPKHFMKDLYNH